MPMTSYPQKITFCEMPGVRDVLVYRRDHPARGEGSLGRNHPNAKQG
jgi:hypothetical protein